MRKSPGVTIRPRPSSSSWTCLLRPELSALPVYHCHCHCHCTLPLPLSVLVFLFLSRSVSTRAISTFFHPPLLRIFHPTCPLCSNSFLTCPHPHCQSRAYPIPRFCCLPYSGIVLALKKQFVTNRYAASFVFGFDFFSHLTHRLASSFISASLTTIPPSVASRRISPLDHPALVSKINTPAIPT